MRNPDYVSKPKSQAKKHGEKKARMMGHDVPVERLENVEVVKRGFTKDKREETKNKFKSSGQDQYGGKFKSGK